jgi:hypothetical protein
MTTPANLGKADRDPRTQGFILVGVAMFILVLTILGLSLFSLSSFESQFMIRSMRQDEAFSLAAGGIERARFALMSTGDLDSVKAFLPRDGVIYAVAMQGPDPLNEFADDSVGPLNPDRDIWVRVVAQSGDSRVRLRAKFHPESADDYYKRLITISQGPGPDLRVNAGNKATLYTQTFLAGAVAENVSVGGDTAWNSPPDNPMPHTRPPIREFAIPQADVGPWITSHLGQAHAVNHVVGSGQYTLDASLYGGVAYFTSPVQNPSVYNVDDNHPNPTITVTGTAVWLLNPGMHFNNHLQIVGQGLNPRLILVAKSAASGNAMQFDSGIDCSPLTTPAIGNDGVSVVMVTDRGIDLDSGPLGNQDSFVGYLSIYAERIYITGPMPGHAMNLWHLPSMVPVGNPVVDPIIDALYALGVLPGGTPVSSQSLTLVPGTWQDLTPGMTP